MKNVFTVEPTSAIHSDAHDNLHKSRWSMSWWFALATLLIFAAALLIWRLLDTRPPAWDETVHLGLALDYQQWLVHDKPFDSRWTAIYPPLYHLSLMPSLLLGMPNEDHIVLTHVVYFALLLWGMGSLSKQWMGSFWTGLLATMLLISMPIVVQTSRQPLIDFALTAWVVAGMEWLRRTQGFTQPRAVILFGLWSGLGLLMKPFYPLWFIGPGLLCAWQGRQATGRWPIKTILLCAVVTLLVALPYYGWQGVMFLRNASQLVSTQGTMEGDPGVQTLAGWWWYVQALKDQAGLLILVMLLIGSVATVWFNAKNTGVQWLLVWVLSGYLLFTLNHNKDMRYTLPLLPPLVLLALWQINTWIEKHRKACWFAAVAIFAFYAITIDPPREEDWQQQNLLRVFAKWRDPGAVPLRVAMISNHPYFFARNLEWAARNAGMPLEATLSVNPDADFNEFVVLKSGELHSDRSDARRRELLTNPAFTGYYTKVATLPLPDGSHADVYHRGIRQTFAIAEVSQQSITDRLHAALAQYLVGSFEVNVSGEPAALQRGEVHQLSITGGPWAINGIPVVHGDIQFRDARLNLYTLWNEQGLGLLDFAEIKPCLELSANELQEWLRTKQPKLNEVQVTMDDGQLRASVLNHGWRLAVELQPELDVEQHAMNATLTQFTLGSVSLPGWILGRVHQQSVSLLPSASLPGTIRIDSIHADAGRLRIGCD